MRLSLRCLLLSVPALVGAGCGAQQRLEQQVADQRARLQTLTNTYEAQNQRVEALRERVELLEDELETARLAATPRALPVVRLSPPARRDADASAVDASETPDSPNQDTPDQAAPIGRVLTQADVEAFGGGVSSGRRGPVPPPENAANAGNIGVARLPSSAAEPVAANAPDPEPIGAYRAAWNQLKAGDVAAAIAGFTRFVAQWPAHSYSDNALFLVGEARLGRAETAAALAAFRRVVDEYPSGNKVPDALYMIGVTLDRMGRAAESKETLARLMSIYPETDAARRAQEALRSRAL